MLVRVVLGFAALIAFVALGAWVNRLRAAGTFGVRRVAARVHWVVGVVAVAILVLLAVTATGLVTR